MPTTEEMSNPTRPRWFQFSRRDLLWLIAVACCLLFALNERRLASQKVAYSHAQADDLVKRMRYKFGSEKLAAEREEEKWKTLYEECRQKSNANEKDANSR